MASISNDPGGRRRILFVASDGTRKTIRLGKASQRDAESVCRHVESLLASATANQPIPQQTAAWLGGIGDVLRGRLAKVGLIAAPEPTVKATLGTFLAEYLAVRTDVKHSTTKILEQAARHVLSCFGESTPLERIGPADADRFKAWVIERGAARSTIAKWCKYARHFFDVATRRRLIASNPFEHVRGAVVGDSARRRFIPADDVRKVLDVIPCQEWRLAIALARWGGVRAPSELAIAWRDVDWEGLRMIVRAPKTEHHADGGVRIVPIFPEVLPHLESVWNATPEGTEYVLPKFRDPGANLRTQLVRYIERAGLQPWPKPWQNMRASRATELADQFPSHVCAAWLGHTEKIADAFYRQVTDDHFARAVGCNQAAQKAAQHVHERSGMDPQTSPPQNEQTTGFPGHSVPCDIVQNCTVGPAGLEPATKGLCVPLRLSPPLSGSWSGPYLHFTCLPSGLYTFCPWAAWFGISISLARFSLPRI